MGTKNRVKLTVILLAAGFVFQESSCIKDCAATTYNFELPVKAYPDNDSINVNDTIWLEINETVVFKNTDGSMVDYSGAANLGTGIGFSYRDTGLKSWVDAADSFSYILIKGNNVDNPRTKLIRAYTFAEQNGRYLFKLGVIPKHKGLFSLLFSNSNNTYRKNDKCTKANFTINFRNTNQHYYLSPSYNGQPDLVGGDYYFVVK